MFRLGVFGFLDLGDESVVKKNLGIYGNFFEISILQFVVEHLNHFEFVVQSEFIVGCFNLEK